jgi:hypothetical protein
MLVGLLVLASFLLAVVEAAGPHTDDGCAVELHCRVCHWSYASGAMVDLPVAVGATLEFVENAHPAAELPAAAPAPREFCPRGPPRT